MRKAQIVGLAAQSLLFCAGHCLSFCPFSFGHCNICTTSIYSFWLPAMIFSNFSYLRGRWNSFHFILSYYPALDNYSKTQQTAEGEFTCYGKVRSSCSISLNRRVTIVTNPVISHEAVCWVLLLNLDFSVQNIVCFVAQSLLFCAEHCLSFCSFSFAQCIICTSLIYSFWLPLWYFQTFSNKTNNVLHRKVKIEQQDPTNSRG
jgi:hypothetical protein